MPDVSYVPGGRTAIAGDSCWVLIDASADSAVVAEIWRRMGLAGPLLDGVIAGILQFGFAHMPVSLKTCRRALRPVTCAPLTPIASG